MMTYERGKRRRCRHQWGILSLTLLFVLSSGGALKAQQAPAVRIYLSNPAFIFVWQATKHLQFQGVISRFLPGGSVKNTFVANGFGFYSSTARYRF